jgi:WD40 repeat protein
MLSVAFSIDSRTIATGSEIMRVWDVSSGELQHTLSSPSDRSLSFAAVHERREWPDLIWQISFSADGRFLLSACPDADTVQIWSTETWEIQQTMRGYGARFSPDAAYLAVSVGHYTTIQIYDTVSWQVESTIHNSSKALASPTFSPDSKGIATYSGREIMLWEVGSGTAVKTFQDPRRGTSALSFSRDGKVLLVGANKCGLRAWDVEAEECLLVLEHEDGARDVKGNGVRGQGTRGDPPAFATLVSHGDAKVAIAFPDGSIKVWEVTW